MIQQNTADYPKEVEILEHMLQPGQPPMGSDFGWEQPGEDEMVYLGEATVKCYCKGVPIPKITSTRWLARFLRHSAQRAGTYQKWCDGVAIIGSELRVGVHYPFSKMSAIERARYRLCVLLLNSQGILEGDAHTWALQVFDQLAARYWDRPGAKRTDWTNEDDSDDEERHVCHIMLAVGIDLEPWGRAYEVDFDAEFPATPPLAWVKETKLAHRLFELSEEELARSSYGEELHRGVAYALHALRESQPPSWSQSLYLNDVLTLDLPTFEACRDRLAGRLETCERLHLFAEQVRQTTAVDQLDECMRALYDEIAPALGVWVIA